MARNSGFTIWLNKKAIKDLTKGQLTAAKKTAGKMRTLIIKDQVIPFQTGMLQNVYTDIDESNLQKGHIQIKHDGPYAARLYYNPQYNFSKTFNKNARGEWWYEYLSGSKKEYATKIFKEYYKRETGV